MKNPRFKLELDTKNYIRLKIEYYIDGKRVREFKSTGIKLSNKEHWNKKDQKVYSGEKNYKHINEKLEVFKKENCEKNSETEDSKVDAPSFLEYFKIKCKS